MAHRVLVVEDHPIFRDGLVQCLEAEGDFTVVGTSDGTEFDAARLAPLAPELVLMDIELAERSGVELTRDPAHLLGRRAAGLRADRASRRARHRAGDGPGRAVGAPRPRRAHPRPDGAGFAAASLSTGFGLGLALARELAEAHGGTVRQEPIDGGALFVLEVPRERAHR